MYFALFFTLPFLRVVAIPYRYFNILILLLTVFKILILKPTLSSAEGRDWSGIWQAWQAARRVVPLSSSSTHGFGTEVLVGSGRVGARRGVAGWEGGSRGGGWGWDASSGSPLPACGAGALALLAGFSVFRQPWTRAGCSVSRCPGPRRVVLRRVVKFVSSRALCLPACAVQVVAWRGVEWRVDAVQKVQSVPVQIAVTAVHSPDCAQTSHLRLFSHSRHEHARCVALARVVACYVRSGRVWMHDTRAAQIQQQYVASSLHCRRVPR